MDKFTKILSSVRQNYVSILTLIASLLGNVMFGYKMYSIQPILLIFVMVIIIISGSNYRHRLLASIYIIANSIFDVAKYTSLLWPMAISLTYLLLGDMCRLTTRDTEGCEILENINNIRTIVSVNFLIALSISILFAYIYSENFKRLMKVLSFEGKLVFLILVAPHVLLSAVFMNDLIRSDRDLFEPISIFFYLVLYAFLLFILIVTNYPEMTAESRHCRR